MVRAFKRWYAIIHKRRGQEELFPAVLGNARLAKSEGLAVDELVSCHSWETVVNITIARSTWRLWWWTFRTTRITPRTFWAFFATISTVDDAARIAVARAGS